MDRMYTSEIRLGHSDKWGTPALVRKLNTLADRWGPAMGMTRRQFIKSQMGLAASFIALNSVFGPFFIVDQVEASVPGYSERASNMYQTYVKQYGTEEWIIDASATYESLCTWEVGFQQAKSVDPTTVMETLYSMPKIDHPISGPSVWGGMEIFGANHHLITPVPIYVEKDGGYAFDVRFNFGEWWEANKVAVVQVLKEGGMIEG